MAINDLTTSARQDYPDHNDATINDMPEKQLQADDIAATVLHGAIETIDLDSPASRRFLDKSCVSYAALWGMQKDAHLQGADYSWLTTIFYVGYLASEFPTNVIFQKFDIARTCGIFVILWGMVLLCMAAANNFPGLLTVRLFLGILEAGVSPCFVLMTAMFYRRNEQPLRTAIWFSMNGMANVFGGLIGYGIGFIKASLPAWKFPFIIFGSVTVAWGIVFTLLAPPNPTKARWLTEEEKTIAVMRVVDNETGLDNKKLKWYQVKEALVDVNFWLFNLLTLANCIPNGGVTAFAPLIVNGFGYNKFQSTLLNMPSGGAQVLALWISGYLATRFAGIRHFLMIGGILVALIGAVLIYALSNEHKVARLIGYYLLVGFSATFVLNLTLVQSNVAGRTKRTMFASSVFISYCVGNLIGPQLFFEREAPRYQSGFASMIVCFSVQTLIIAVMYLVNLRENRRRDRTAVEGQAASNEVRIAMELSDLTDRENLHFRYLL